VTGAADHARVLVAEASYDNLEPVIERVIEDLDLASWLAGTRGKTVFIKPNMLGLFEPDRHATTHPSMIAALVRLFREAGAEVTVGDNCGVGGYGMSQAVAKRTGIEAAADGAWVNVAKDTVNAPLQSRFLDSIVVSRAMVEADFVVNVPKMKTHSLTVVTGAVKNMFGLVSGMGKGRTHGAAPGVKDFGSMLADIYSIRPPDLSIMDAVVAMEGGGPSSGDLKPMNRVLASTNAVALDAVMSRMMGLPAEEVIHLMAAHRRGHGPIDAGAIETVGLPADEVRFKLPVTVRRFSMVGRFVNQRFFAPMSRGKLVLVKKKCEQCGICAKGCPVGACVMEDKFPVIDQDACIRCFCCHELCPESAWELSSFFGRFAIGRRT